MILLTGFGPFGKFTQNLSGEIVRKIKSKISNQNIIKKVLPVSWKLSLEVYKNILNLSKPHLKLVILSGIHSNKHIHIEKYGWNIAFGKDVDNKFKFGVIKYQFPLRVKTILDINHIYANFKDRTNISISYFGGTYICNYLYYWALSFSNYEYPVVFVHLPYNLDLNTSVKKIEEIINIIIKEHYKKIL